MFRRFHCALWLTLLLSLPWLANRATAQRAQSESSNPQSAAEKGGASSAASPQLTVQHVLVRDSGAALEVEIQTSGAASPNTQAITGPDRIVVDFPGAVPAAELRALKLNRGALKGVRSGLFFSNPPITRIVLDLTGPLAYQITTDANSTVVKLGLPPADGNQNQIANVPAPHPARLQDALAKSPSIPVAHVTPASVSPRVSAVVPPKAAAPSGAVPNLISPKPAAPSAVAPNLTASISPPPPPAASAPTVGSAPALAATSVPSADAPTLLDVTYEGGLLRIHASRATLSQVLYEVHLRTKAEIPIPAGAEQERVFADLGPAPARDVLSALLNGTPYNFIFVGDELAIERVILSRREPGN